MTLGRRTTFGGFLLLAFAPLVGQSLAESRPASPPRCYARLSCIGNVAVSGAPAQYELLIRSFFRVPSGGVLPSLAQLRETEEERLLDFERVCNAERYARTSLPADLQAAWNADTRDMYAELAPACVSGCSELQGPCDTDADCCSAAGGRERVVLRRCEPSTRTCVVGSAVAQNLEE